MAKKAKTAWNLYFANLRAAKRAGKHDAVNTGLQWYFEHLPPDESGERIISTSVDKPVEKLGYTGPAISIGFSMGGIASPPEQKLLEPATSVIDVTPEPNPQLSLDLTPDPESNESQP